MMMQSYIHFTLGLDEEAPVNNAGSGNIQGLGIGVNPEPGFSKKVLKLLSRKRRKNRDARL